MELRSRKNKLDTTNEPLSKRQTIRPIGNPTSEPIQASSPMISSPSVQTTKPDTDTDDLRKQYANNPQALQALDDHFTGSRKENVNYSSYFFRKDIVDNFTKNVMSQITEDKKSSFPLSSYKLYNADDILENIGQRGTLKTRFTEQTSDYQKLRQQNMDKLIKYLSSKICQDIDSEYAKTAVEKAVSLTERTNIFDIVIISSKNIEAIGLTSEIDEDSDDEQEAGSPDDSDDEDEDYELESDD